MARYFNTKRSLANYQSEKNGFLGIPFGIRENECRIIFVETSIRINDTVFLGKAP